MRLKRCMTLACLAVAASFVVGCAPTRLELDYGTSQRLVKMNQIVPPESDQADRPVAGVDGEAAKNAHTEYRKSFTKPGAETGSVVETLR